MMRERIETVIIGGGQAGLATAYPGLYFVGMPWLTTQQSGLLVGVGDDAAFIAEHIAANQGAP